MVVRSLTPRWTRQKPLAGLLKQTCWQQRVMNEQEVYLVSSIDETFIGTVGAILRTGDGEIRNTRNFFSDLVSEIAFGQNIDMSMPFTIELRDPTGF